MRNETLVPLILVQNDEYWLPYALDAIRERFARYVIYDVGSSDKTRAVLDWFISKEEKDADIFFRFLPQCPPEVQGAFRNSMIAEARSDWYFIVDGDEVYTKSALDTLLNEMPELILQHELTEGEKIYGVCRRREISYDIKSAYSELRSHHRVYHRKAIFKGTHPGEEPYYAQGKKSEWWFSRAVICEHFHNTIRSEYDDMALSRTRRKSKHTYHPGSLFPFDTFRQIPALIKPIEQFKVNPELKKLQENYVVL